MQKKSVLSIVLILMLVLVSLTGCFSKDAEEPAETTETTETTEETPVVNEEPKEKVEISFWYGWGGPEGEALEKIIAEFNASQDRIVVKGTLEGDYSKQLTAITAGSPPDIASQFGTNSVPWGMQGAMTPLDDYIKMSNLELSQFIPGALSQSQYNGVTYALPINMHISMLLYNKDLLAEAGYDGPPETVQQLYEYAEKLSVIDPDGKIQRLGINPNLDIYTYSYAFGGSFYDFDRKEITPQDLGFIKSMKQSADLWAKFGGGDKLWPFFETHGAYQSADNAFFTGKFAMTIDGEWLPTFIKQFAPDLNYGIAPLPYDEANPQLSGSGMVNTSTFYIPKGAKHPDEAWEFLNWFVQKENVVKFAAAIGNLPPRLDSLEDPIFNDVAGFKEFLEHSKNRNLVTFPALPYMGEYMNEIGAAYNEVLIGNITAEVAAKQIADKMKPIVEKFK